MQYFLTYESSVACVAVAKSGRGSKGAGPPKMFFPICIIYFVKKNFVLDNYLTTMIIYRVFLDMCKQVQEVIPWAKIRKNGKGKIVCLGHRGNFAYGKKLDFYSIRVASNWENQELCVNFRNIPEITKN